MTRWQRRARFVLGVFAIAFLVFVIFAFKRRGTGAPAAVVPTDHGAVVVSTGGQTQRFRLSREDVNVRYEKLLTYADGTSKLVGVTITTDDRGGRRSFTVTGKEGQVGQQESTIQLDGDVRLTSTDGTTVRTEHASYTNSDGAVTSQGPASFEKGRMSG